MKVFTNNRLSELIALTILVGSNIPVVAAEDESAEGEGIGDRILVTGSHIKRIDNESTSPVLQIDREDIERSGATSLSEYLQLLAFNSGGTFNEQFTQGFAPGAAGFDLRGFRTDRTLILLNGRRLPIYPFADRGSIAFVDTNGIPLASIERIEILKDGASAVYGSDAIAGVVNIITTTEYDGARANVHLGGTQHGGGQEGRFSLLAGSSSSDLETSLVVEYKYRQEILGADRDYANSVNGPFAADFGDSRSFVGYPGTFVREDLTAAEAQDGCATEVPVTDTGLGGIPGITGTACLFDSAPARQLMPGMDRIAINTAIKYLMDDYSLFARASINQVDTVSKWPIISPTPLNLSFYIPVGGPGNPFPDVGAFYTRALTEFGAPTIETSSLSHNLLVGAEGMFGEFDWETTLGYASTRVSETYADGWLRSFDFSELSALVGVGFVDITQPLSTALIESFSTSFQHDGDSDIAMMDLKVSGPLADLPTGIMWMAAGIEFRSEEFYDTSDEEILNGEVFGLGSSVASGDREAFAAYTELAIPIYDWIEFSVAGRFDNYSDFGSTFNPKVGMRITPIDSFLLRLSYGTGFKAPGLHELQDGQIASGSSGGIGFQQVGTPALDAEKSESITLGLLFNPTTDIEISLDFWQIDAEDLVSSVSNAFGAANIVANSDAAGFFIVDGAPFDANSDGVIDNNDIMVFRDGGGNVLFIRDPFINVAGRLANGVDLGIKFRFAVDDFDISLRSEIVYVNSLEEEAIADQDAVETSGEYLYPELRANALLTVGWGDLSQSLAVKYIHEYNQFPNAALEAVQPTIDGWLVLDYQVGYDVTQSTRLLFGMKNLLDADPPEQAGSWPHYNRNLHNPQGRFFYLEWEQYF